MADTGNLCGYSPCVLLNVLRHSVNFSRELHQSFWLPVGKVNCPYEESIQPFIMCQCWKHCYIDKLIKVNFRCVVPPPPLFSISLLNKIPRDKQQLKEVKGSVQNAVSGSCGTGCVDVTGADAVPSIAEVLFKSVQL